MNIFEQALIQPITCILIISMSLIWFYLNQYLIPVEKISFCYEKMVTDGEYWRGITSTFTHYSFLHLVFNMGSLWSYGYLEYNNTIHYLKITFILIIMSFLIQIIFYKILIDKFDMVYYKTVNCIGYSGVVFGLMTIASMITKGSGILGKDLYLSVPLILFEKGLPLSYMPFLSLMITQLIVPQASLLGHLSGIIVGYSIHFGLFNCLRKYIPIIISNGDNDSNNIIIQNGIILNQQQPNLEV
eukprot:gene5180-8786_t